MPDEELVEITSAEEQSDQESTQPTLLRNKHTYLYFFTGVVFIVILGFAYFMYPLNGAPTLAEEEEEYMPAYVGKKVMYIDSYHAGYEWSDGITKGVRDVLQPAGVELEVVRMDTKRNVSEEFAIQAAGEARNRISAFNPDVLIVSDDNAFQYLVQEYYRDAELPIVFSGLNWDAGLYDAPYTNTAGMVEVSLTLQIIDHLKPFARGGSIGYLSSDTNTEKKNLLYYGELFGLDFDAVYFVKTFDEWKQAYKALQDEVDMVIFENNAGILDWDDTEAARFAEEHIRVPIGTTNPWTMPESVLGITKIPEEQGEWSAEAALRVLGGEPVAQIGTVKNRQGKLMVNLTLADKIGAIIPPGVLKNAEIVQ